MFLNCELNWFRVVTVIILGCILFPTHVTSQQQQQYRQPPFVNPPPVPKVSLFLNNHSLTSFIQSFTHRIAYTVLKSCALLQSRWSITDAFSIYSGSWADKVLVSS